MHSTRSFATRVSSEQYVFIYFHAMVWQVREMFGLGRLKESMSWLMAQANPDIHAALMSCAFCFAVVLLLCRFVVIGWKGVLQAEQGSDIIDQVRLASQSCGMGMLALVHSLLCA